MPVDYPVIVIERDDQSAKTKMNFGIKLYE